MFFSQIFYEIMILYEFFSAKVKAPVLHRPLDASVSGTTAQVYVIKEQQTISRLGFRLTLLLPAIASKIIGHLTVILLLFYGLQIEKTSTSFKHSAWVVLAWDWQRGQLCGSAIGKGEMEVGSYKELQVCEVRDTKLDSHEVVHYPHQLVFS